MKALVISRGKTNSLELNHEQNEFAMLLKEIGYEVVSYFSQDIENIDKNTYLGSGKIHEIAAFYHQYNEENQEEPIDIIACNFELSGLQKKAISAITKAEIIDRTFVILNIFEKNAKTKEAKLQVEIARLEYLKNHLVDEKASYSQVTSGSGHNKGKGEKQIELSKRQIARAVLEKNALFATLETSTRNISVFGYPTFFLTDTVGFISHLPVYLVDAFRSTLEEIKEADLLVQVVDLSDPFKDEEIKTTKGIIKDLEADNIPMINIYNKYDLLGGFANFIPGKDEILVSLLDDNDLEEPLKFIVSNATKDWERRELTLPYSVDFATFSKENYVISHKEKEDGYLVDVYLNPAYKYKYIRN